MCGALSLGDLQDDSGQERGLDPPQADLPSERPAQRVGSGQPLPWMNETSGGQSPLHPLAS